MESIRVMRVLILFTTSLAAFQTPFNSTVLSFIVPVLGKYFHASLYTLVYVPVVYLIPLPTLMVLLGRIADIYGRERVFRIGFALFIVGSLMGAFSPSIYVLIASSLVMGLGSSILSPSSTAIVSQVFPEGERGFALGINAMAVYMGLTSAPFLGGLITQFLGWRFVLLVTTLLSVIGLAVSFVSMRGIDLPRRGIPIDAAGAASFSIALLSIVIFMILAATGDWLNYLYLPVISAASFALFIVIEGRVKDPMLNLSLFTRNISFMAGNVTALLNYISTYSVPFLFSLYLQSILGYTPFEAGLILIPEPVFMVILSPISGRLSDIYGSREVAALGMGLIGLAFIMLLILNLRSVVNVVLALSVLGVGFGFFSAPNTNSVMGSITRDKYGVASGVLGTMRFTGQLLSITLASAILAKYLGKYTALYLFTGVPLMSTIVYGLFTAGLRIMFIIAAALSFIGAYTSLLRER
ncbi:MFS transporter [Caldivirga maquilingensis]|uniref:Major facilitator superfamily MFS_1 n=1 Tax=Caldivirga maquilingensis (strain ATCC 700844 / DSM 13496 / JCM 10307 / IC-167) TaxID=397948 RepID=A8MBE3_CALMQ|nr:MFS transporter [Caldivirga maquilingensis]ABW01233.1 major facilitator superfamily MFS_1 [Caldivirga maquilingensis IC-167]